MAKENITRTYVIVLDIPEATILARVLKDEGKTCDEWLAEQIRKYKGEEKK